MFFFTLMKAAFTMQIFILPYVGIVGGDAVTFFWGDDEDDELTMKNVDFNEVPKAWFKG